MIEAVHVLDGAHLGALVLRLGVIGVHDLPDEGQDLVLPEADVFRRAPGQAEGLVYILPYHRPRVQTEAQDEGHGAENEAAQHRRAEHPRDERGALALLSVFFPNGLR